ncbi:hypothetical protein L6164_006151 [Bauhinia variegata]|nr:hypothetical protein L6164_006151 [Bauhinia variegata]
MTDQTGSPCQTIDPYKFLQIIPHPNGSITRLRHDPQTSLASNPNLPISVLSKDITIDQSHNTFIRIFLPRKALDHASSNRKLPLVVFFHGGGFIFLSASSTLFHVFCSNMANDTEAVVVSVNYRLAPEHRLPAAYDDAMKALHWIQTHPGKEEWLSKYADYSNCYLMGSSAGGNIAYHTGLRAAVELHHRGPLKIKGLILVQPFFGGVKRTASELRLMNDSHLPLCATDLMWELSLPRGADRDHEYCNLTVGNGSKQLDEMERLRWRVLVTGCDGDPLFNRQREVVNLVAHKRVRVVEFFVPGQYHGIQDHEPSKAKPLFDVVKHFTFPLIQ